MLLPTTVWEKNNLGLKYIKEYDFKLKKGPVCVPTHILTIVKSTSTSQTSVDGNSTPWKNVVGGIVRFMLFID